MASMEAAYITFFIFGTFLIFEAVRERMGSGVQFDDRAADGLCRRAPQGVGHLVIEREDAKVAGMDYGDGDWDRLDHLGDGRQKAFREGCFEQLCDRFGTPVQSPKPPQIG